MRTVQEYNPRLEIGGMFFTQWNGRKNVSKVVYDLLYDAFGEYMLPTNISVSKNIEEGSLAQEPLLAYDRGNNKCSATKEYLKLTEHIING